MKEEKESRRLRLVCFFDGQIIVTEKMTSQTLALFCINSLIHSILSCEHCLI